MTLAGWAVLRPLIEVRGRLHCITSGMILTYLSLQEKTMKYQFMTSIWPLASYEKELQHCSWHTFELSDL